MFRKEAGECSGKKQENVQERSRRVFRKEAGECSGKKQESVQERSQELYKKKLIFQSKF